MNYEAERAMNQKRLRMEGEPGHGVVQGNGLPLNYIDNGHQIPYQPYAGAYNTHYPPPDAFSPYGPPPPGGYAPQNLSYAPPAHQNYPHHQSFPPQQPPQAQLHMQSHMVQGYGDVGVHKAAWPPQPHLLPPLDAQKPLDVKQLKPEIKLEPTDSQKRPHPENEMMGGDLDQPKIKIKTDIFKPDDLAHRPLIDKPLDIAHKPLDPHKPADLQSKDDGHPGDKTSDKSAEACKAEGAKEAGDAPRPLDASAAPADKSEEDRKPFSSPEGAKMATTPGKTPTSSLEPKKRGRPKGSTNKPKPPGAATPTKLSPNMPGAMSMRGATPRPMPPVARPRATGYQYAIRPFRKDFSGIQFRRRWSDDCLDSSHIPNEVYFGDVPVSMEVLFNYYDANAEREKLATQAAQIAAQKAAAAKLAAAKLQARGLLTNEVTTVDSSSSDDSSGSSGSESEDSDDETPLKRGPGRPKGSKNSSPKPKTPGTPGSVGRRGRPPVPPELRQPGITDMKKFCKAAGIRFDYKKLVEGCTKNKERVQKMMDLLTAAGLEGKPTIEKCKALKQAKVDKKEQEKQAKKEAKTTKHKEKEGKPTIDKCKALKQAKVDKKEQEKQAKKEAKTTKHKEKEGKPTIDKCKALKQAKVDKKEQEKQAKKEAETTKHKEKEGAEGEESSASRRMTRGATGVKPRQRIVISSDEEDDTPAARRTLSKLRSSVNDSDSD